MFTKDAKNQYPIYADAITPSDEEEFNLESTVLQTNCLLKWNKGKQKILLKKLAKYSMVSGKLFKWIQLENMFWLKSDSFESYLEVIQVASWNLYSRGFRRAFQSNSYPDLHFVTSSCILKS